MRKELAVLAAASLLVTTATAQNLMGQSPEAQVIDVPVVQGRIDAISGVVYSQVFERGRSVRGLKMTLFVPRTKEKKPAVLYFPGGGFTSADHEKFLEMRYALARAGYVVAACEYRAVPNKFPALLEDAKAAVSIVPYPINSRHCLKTPRRRCAGCARMPQNSEWTPIASGCLVTPPADTSYRWLVPPTAKKTGT